MSSRLSAFLQWAVLPFALPFLQKGYRYSQGYAQRLAYAYDLKNKTQCIAALG